MTALRVVAAFILASSSPSHRMLPVIVTCVLAGTNSSKMAATCDGNTTEAGWPEQTLCVGPHVVMSHALAGDASGPATVTTMVRPAATTCDASTVLTHRCARDAARLGDV